MERKMTAEELLDKMEEGLRILEKRLNDKVKYKKPDPKDLKKNSHLHFFLETSLHDGLRKEAKEKGMHLSELVRWKLRENNQLDRIEGKIDRILHENANN